MPARMPRTMPTRRSTSLASPPKRADRASAEPARFDIAQRGGRCPQPGKPRPGPSIGPPRRRRPPAQGRVCCGGASRATARAVETPRRGGYWPRFAWALHQPARKGSLWTHAGSTGHLAIQPVSNIQSCGETYKLTPGIRLDSQYGSRPVLRVADVDRNESTGHLNALPTRTAAVTALEPGKLRYGSRRLYDAHVSPNHFSTTVSDSRGVSPCARRTPYCSSNSRTDCRSV